MPLQPIDRRSVADAAFDQLVRAIVGGELVAGQALPAERSLVEVLGVNRQAVREALKRLEQAGLVTVRHGGGTTVCDIRTSAGLDVLPLLLAGGGSRDPALLRGVLEMRRSLGADAAGLCAQRAIGEHLVALDDVLEAQRSALATDDLATLAALDWRFWTAVVDGADNLAYRLAFNSLAQVAEPLADELPLVLEGEWRDVAAHEALVASVRAGDGPASERAARALLSGSLGRIAGLLAAAPATDEEVAT